MWILKASGVIAISCLLVFLPGCGPSPMSEAKRAFSSDEIAQGAQLSQTYCNTCHGVGNRSMDEMLAPPLLGVRDAYIQRYPEPDAFVKAVVDFTQHPKWEETLMPHAIESYGLKDMVTMPESDLRLTAIALYAGQIEKPSWMRDYRKSVDSEK